MGNGCEMDVGSMGNGWEMDGRWMGAERSSLKHVFKREASRLVELTSQVGWLFCMKFITNGYTYLYVWKSILMITN